MQTDPKAAATAATITVTHSRRIQLLLSLSRASRSSSSQKNSPSFRPPLNQTNHARRPQLLLRHGHAATASLQKCSYQKNSTIEIAAWKKKLNLCVKFNHNVPEASKQESHHLALCRDEEPGTRTRRSSCEKRCQTPPISECKFSGREGAQSQQNTRNWVARAFIRLALFSSLSFLTFLFSLFFAHFHFWMNL
jgi:hypothetical protein